MSCTQYPSRLHRRTKNVREGGMRCLKTFLRCHCQHADVDLKPFSSSNNISILLSDCTFGTIVVLEVILVTQATLKVTELNA